MKLIMDEALISKFTSLGCDRKQAAVSLQVYMELCEIKRYWNVHYKFSKELVKLVLYGSRSKSEPLDAFVPLADSDKLSFGKIDKILSSQQDYKRLYLVFVNADSTCVYYQSSKGLDKPTEISVKHLKQNHRELIDLKLKQNEPALAQSALLGIPLNLDKNAN